MAGGGAGGKQAGAEPGLTPGASQLLCSRPGFAVRPVGRRRARGGARASGSAPCLSSLQAWLSTLCPGVPHTSCPAPQTPAPRVPGPAGAGRLCTAVPRIASLFPGRRLRQPVISSALGPGRATHTPCRSCQQKQNQGTSGKLGGCPTGLGNAGPHSAPPSTSAARAGGLGASRLPGRVGVWAAGHRPPAISGGIVNWRAHGQLGLGTPHEHRISGSPSAERVRPARQSRRTARPRAARAGRGAPAATPLLRRLRGFGGLCPHFAPRPGHPALVEAWLPCRRPSPGAASLQPSAGSHVVPAGCASRGRPWPPCRFCAAAAPRPRSRPRPPRALAPRLLAAGARPTAPRVPSPAGAAKPTAGSGLRPGAQTRAGKAQLWLVLATR